MEVLMRMPVVVLLLLAAAVPSAAQSVITPPPAPIVANLSGPRFGITTLSDEIVTNLRDRYLDVQPVITQFGWQFEKQFYSTTGGAAMLNEWVVLLGGLDQGVALPSVSWLVGLRTEGGTEFGIGPNVTPVGWSLAFAAGTTLRTGFLNVPVNIAVVPSRNGMRVSFLTGFSKRR
jgi:hypothetical protein